MQQTNRTACPGLGYAEGSEYDYYKWAEQVIPPLEAVADAIMSFEGWRPGTRSYRNRNPGNLRVGPVVEGSYGVYPSLVDGYSALLRELQAKFSGNNSHHIGPDSTLLDLFNVYAPPSDNNPTNDYCNFVASFVTKALGVTVTPETKLGDIWKSPSSS